MKDYGPPTWVVEVGASSLRDDLGAKRLLYERLGVAESWVVHVAERRVIAFSVADQRSRKIKAYMALRIHPMLLVRGGKYRDQPTPLARPDNSCPLALPASSGVQ